MEQHTISNHQIASFAGKLQQDERSPATIENYLRHIRAFAAWAGEQAVTKELVASWKEHLTGKDTAPAPSTPCWCRSTGSWAFWGGTTAS